MPSAHVLVVIEFYLYICSQTLPPFLLIKVVKRKLENPIVLPVFSSKRDAVTGSSNTVKEHLLCAGDSTALYIGAAPDSKLPKDATAGKGVSCISNTHTFE